MNHRRTALKLAGALLSAAIAMGSPNVGAAQATTGVGDDAIPLPKHGARIRIAGLWSSYDSRFAPTVDGGYEKSPLFAQFARENFGAADNPALSKTQSDIRALTGLGDAFALSLGKLEARGDVSKQITPLQIEYGFTNRLSVSVLVPYVETTSNNRFTLNRDTATARRANVGPNPAFSATGNARAANNTVVTQIEASRNALIAEIARCTSATESGRVCDAIRANPAAANGLLSQAAQIRAQISTIYGTTGVPGAPVVPLVRSTAQTAIEQKLANLRTAFDSFDSNEIGETTRPVGSSTIYGTGRFAEIIKDSTYGLAYDTLMNGGRAGIGDVEVAATFVLLNSIGSSQYNRLNLSRRAIRTSVTGGWRFGTATGGRSGNPFDLPTGDGANALLLRSTTDLIWSRRFWISGTVRYSKPLADNVVSRFPMLNDTSLFRPSIVLDAERKLGARTEIEIAPRMGIGRAFGLSAAYGLGRQASSTLQTTLPDLDLTQSGMYGPALASTQASTIHSIQFGASYSSLNAFVRGKSRWPVEVLYSHGMILAASGGVVPAESFDRIELRIYTRFPRR